MRLIKRWKEWKIYMVVDVDLESIDWISYLEVYFKDRIFFCFVLFLKIKIFLTNILTVKILSLHLKIFTFISIYKSSGLIDDRSILIY